MSPSRKLSVIGLIAGGSAVVVGVLGFVVPLLLIFHTMSSRRGMMNLEAHQGMLVGSMMSWIVAAPVGTILIMLGAPTFLLSLIIYIDTRRKEGIRVDETTNSQSKLAQGEP